jgi:hypothetical protein
MKKIFKKLNISRKKRLDPNKPEERKEIIRSSVKRTVKEYGEALKKLGAD